MSERRVKCSTIVIRYIHGNQGPSYCVKDHRVENGYLVLDLVDGSTEKINSGQVGSFTITECAC